MDEIQPANVISPHGANQPTSPQGIPPEPTRPPLVTDEPLIAPAPDSEQATTQSNLPRESSLYKPGGVAAPPEASGWADAAADQSGTAASQSLPPDLQWAASEFNDHDKSLRWFVSLAAAGVVLAVLVYLLTKDKITTGIIVLTAVAFGFFAAHKPNDQAYSLSHDGLQIGTKFYSFREFKSFSTAVEPSGTSIVLMPLKRFMPPLTVYLSALHESAVIDYLAEILPFEPHKVDALDSLLKRIHF